MTQQSPNSLIRICHHDHNNQIRNMNRSMWYCLSYCCLMGTQYQRISSRIPLKAKGKLGNNDNNNSFIQINT